MDHFFKINLFMSNIIRIFVENLKNINKMRKIGILLAIFLISIIGLSLTGCTGNSRAKNYGGTHTIKLDAGDKLLEGTWKGDNLWLLTRKRKTNETIETYKFQEDSSFGIMEGTIIIKEQ